MYEEDDYLQLSGIQHFAFCPRQWALIHVENKWAENYLSSLGRILHQKVHSDTRLEKRGKVIIARSVKISSAELGVSGECDVVEFHKNENGISLKAYSGLYMPYPVEYKRGKSKVNDCDRLQLCAQALCLEHMLLCKINCGAIFYGEPRRREVVEFTTELRTKLVDTLATMHDYYKRQHTPRAEKRRNCNSCSLKEECVPDLHKKNKAVEKYIEDGLL